MDVPLTKAESLGSVVCAQSQLVGSTEQLFLFVTKSNLICFARSVFNFNCFSTQSVFIFYFGIYFLNFFVKNVSTTGFLKI